MQVLQWLGRLASESPPSLALSSTPAAFVLQLHSRHRASPRGPSGAPSGRCRPSPPGVCGGVGAGLGVPAPPVAKLCSAALPSRTLASPPLGCCWWRHSTLPMPGCPSRWHGLALGSTSCPVCWLEAEWQCFGPRATNCGVKVETQAFDKDWPYPSSAKAPRLEVQDWRLKIEDSPGALFENLQSRIEDWRFPRSLVGESLILDWRLKIPQDSCWRIFNPGLKIEDSSGLVGESLIQEKISNLQSGIEDSPGRVLENLQSSIFNPGLKILQGESWKIFNLQSGIEDSLGRVLENLQSSIRDWRFSRESPGKSSIFNLGLKIPKPELKSELQVWTSQIKQGFYRQFLKAYLQCIYIWHPQSNLMKLKMVDFWGGCHIYIYIYIYILICIYIYIIMICDNREIWTSSFEAKTAPKRGSWNPDSAGVAAFHAPRKFF